jgi:hypothetical protein
MDKRQYSPPCNPSLKKIPTSFVEIGLIYSRKLLYKYGKIYRATADPLDESLNFSPVIGLVALALFKDKPAQAKVCYFPVMKGRIL